MNCAHRPSPRCGATDGFSIAGINHITLQVSDLDTSLDFWQRLLGCRLCARWSAGAYLEAGELWLCLSVGESRPAADYSHLAFSVDAERFGGWRARLEAAGVPIWQENRSEGDSIYCTDPDGHKLELHVGDLASRLAALEASDKDRLELFDRSGEPVDSSTC